MRQYEQKNLTKNHMSGTPNFALFLDTETKHFTTGKEQRHKMYMAWSCYWRQRREGVKDQETWKYWTDNIEMWSYVANVCRAKLPLWVFGHNIFFDLQASGFMQYFTRQGWTLNFHYDKGLTYILSIQKDKKKIQAVSTTNYFPNSLAQLAQVVDLPKLNVDFNSSSIEDISQYCRRDVEIIKASMFKLWAFLNKHEMGKFRMSKAGQAMSAYRHRFMNTPISIHKETDLQDFERKAYYGGRTECFYLGKCKGGPFASYDVNSMYPYVMKRYAYPSRLVDDYKSLSITELTRALKRRHAVSEVLLETDEPAYPTLKDKKLIFPIGRFKAYLTTESLKYGLEHDHIKEVRQTTLYERADLFTDYINYFYELKAHYTKENNKIMTVIVKHFLNNLYGKWAQKHSIVEEKKDITFDGYYRREVFDLETGKTETTTKLFNTLTVVFGEETASSAFIAIAAHITDNARLQLWRLIKKVGLENVLYCDTDSLKLPLKYHHILEPYLDDYELGRLKLEYETWRLKIYGLKDYRDSKHVKIKGIPRRAVRSPSGSYTFDCFLGQNSHLRREVDNYFLVKKITKVLKREYTKGVVHKNGRITPFVLSEW